MVPTGKAVLDDQTTLNATYGYTMKSYLNTALRRTLCDVRDRYICKSRTLRRFISKINAP